jgi:hypothetical protein
MKTSKTSKIIRSTALAVLVIHPCATAVHAGVAVSIGQNFTGSIDSLNFYPEPAGGVSEDYFVEFNVDTFAVYNKADGSPVQSMTDADFWAQAGIAFAIPSYRNTRIVYDPTVQRWFAAESIGLPTGELSAYHFLLAVSATADPTGSWNGMYVTNGNLGTNSSPFLSMGLDAQGIYVSQRVIQGALTIGSTLFSLPKADLLAIPPVITNRTWFGALSSATYGYGIQPAICLDGAAGGDLVATSGRGRTGDNNNTLFAFAVQNAGGPGPATLSTVQADSVADYSGPYPDALQPDGSSNLFTPNAQFSADALRISTNIFVTGDALLGGRNSIRWYRLSTSNHAVLESGTYSDPSLDLYYPSIAANTNGTVVIAFNGSGTNTFVSCYAMVGQTVNGVTTFDQPLLLKAGAASYQNLNAGNNFWGEYSTTCVDLTDQNVFWTINAYAAGSTNWATQITQLLTSPSPLLSIAGAGPNVLLSWPVTAVPFQLQSAPNLTDTNSWSPVTMVAVTNAATVSVLMPGTNGGSFFRLIQSQQ